jgi:hypothetical protein
METSISEACITSMVNQIGTRLDGLLQNLLCGNEARCAVNKAALARTLTGSESQWRRLRVATLNTVILPDEVLSSLPDETSVRDSVRRRLEVCSSYKIKVFFVLPLFGLPDRL